MTRDTEHATDAQIDPRLHNYGGMFAGCLVFFGGVRIQDSWRAHRRRRLRACALLVVLLVRKSRMMRQVALLASLASVGAQAATKCWKNGTYAPCGPGNDQCGPPVDESLRPRFHIVDQACKINDPNFPFYDEVHGMYHVRHFVSIFRTLGRLISWLAHSL